MPSDDFSGMDIKQLWKLQENETFFLEWNRFWHRNSTGIGSRVLGEKTAPSQVLTPTGISNPSEVSISTELSTPREILNPDEVSTPSSTKLTPSQVSNLTEVSTPRGNQTTTMAPNPFQGKHTLLLLLFFFFELGCLALS